MGGWWRIIPVVVVPLLLGNCTHVDKMVEDAQKVYADARMLLNAHLEEDQPRAKQSYGIARRVNPPRIFVVGKHPSLTGFVATSISAKGFNVVGQRHHSGTITARQVRYFHDVDKKAAQELAEAFDANLKDFTFYRPKPTQGSIEFWPESK